MERPAVLLLALLPLGCTTSAKTATEPSGQRLDLGGQTRMEQEELREDLEAYCSSMLRTIKNITDEIDQQAQDPELRRTLLIWRIFSFRDARSVIDATDPRVGLIDMWALCLQRKDWLRTEEVSRVLGPHLPLAIRGAETLCGQIEGLARDFFRGEAFAEVREGVETFAREHPWRDASRPPARVSIAAESGGALPWFSRWTGLAATTEGVRTIALEIDQINWMVAWLPTVARWETRLLLLDVARNPLVTGLAEDINRTSLTLARLEQQSRELPRNLREEVAAALDEIDGKQDEVRKTLRQTQDLIRDSRETVEAAQGIVATVDRNLQGRPEMLAAVEQTTESLTALSSSLQPTVQEVRGLLADLEKKSETSRSEEAVPTAEVLASVERTSQELTASTEAIQASLVELRGLLHSDDLDRRLGGAGAAARDVVDHLFWRGVWFLLIAVVAVVAGGLVYQRARPSGPR
ncbi:MAG: hypothetical protein ACYTEZ_19320 [Planctomycetota bacterium]